MSEASQSPVARAVWTAAAVSLLVTLVRLLGELQHWHPAVFGTGAGGDNSPLGITWLVLPFGFWFGRALAKNGSRPASLGKTALFCLLGIGLTVGVFALAVTQIADWQLRMLVLGGGTAACGLIALIAWPRMWMTLVAYGFLARLPVLAALGMKGRQVMALFLLEGTLIGVVGAVIGCLAGVGLVMLIRMMGGFDFSFAAGMGEVTALMGTHLMPVLTVADVVVRGVLVALIAGLASLYPAWQASRKEPATALHHV